MMIVSCWSRTVDSLKETGHKVYEESCERVASGKDKVSEVFEKRERGGGK
jgi:hypothetical protein